MPEPVVLHVVHSLGHGGTERFLGHLLHRLAGDGMRHVVCTLRAAGELAATLDPRIHVHPLNLADRSPWGVLRLARLIRRERCTIVHARNPGTWTDTLLACRIARPSRVVLGFHGLQTSPRFTRSQRLRLRVLGAHRHTFTAVSHASRDVLLEDLGCNPASVHVLSNGVDTFRFRPPTRTQREMARAHWGVGPDELALGTVGNLYSSIKGHQVLLDAIARLVRQRGDLRLLLAGVGPLGDALRQQARAAGILDRVHFLGSVEHPAELLAALDVYVCPSLSEGMSNALLEAMACARACVATDVSDHRRMFERCAATDLLVPPGDAAALAEAIRTLLDDETRRERLGASARQRVETDYPVEQAVAGYARFYRALLPAALASPVESVDPIEAARCLS